MAKQIAFPLLLLHLNGASERNAFPRRDEKALSYSNSMVQSKIKVHEILSQPCYLELFMVCLAAFTSQITAAKMTRLVIHPSKSLNGGMLYKWSLGITVSWGLQGVRVYEFVSEYNDRTE